MNNDFEYYVIERNGNKAFPIVAEARDSRHTQDYLYRFDKEKEIADPITMEFVFREPIPSKPVIGDYFSQTESIVSEKIAGVLQAMNIKGIQLIPATVKSHRGEVYSNFFYIHIYHIIEAMDKENSDFRLNKYGIYFIDSFLLDKKILEKIPLENRLVFKLKEDKTMNLYHQSVVEAIMATHPEGVQFIRVDDWVL